MTQTVWNLSFFNCLRVSSRADCEGSLCREDREGDKMRGWRRGIALLLACAMLVGTIPQISVSAKAKVKLNRSSVTLYVGKTATLQVKNYKKKVKWSCQKKSILQVKSSGKVKAKIKGKKAGTTKVYAKVGSKKLSCKVTVKKKKTTSKAPTAGNVSTPSATPKITVKPVSTPSARQKYLGDQSVIFREEEGRHWLYFSVKLSDNKTRAVYDGTIEVTIVNVDGDTVYRKTRDFTAKNYTKKVQDSDGTTGFLCGIAIENGEIEPGSSEMGTVYYSVSLTDGTWFSKKSKSIAHLPVIKLEETPIPYITKAPVKTPVGTETATQLPTGTPVQTPSATPQPTPTATVPPSRDQRLEEALKQLETAIQSSEDEDAEGNACLCYRGFQGEIYRIRLEEENQILYIMMRVNEEYIETLYLYNQPCYSNCTQVVYQSSSETTGESATAFGSMETGKVLGTKNDNWLVMGSMESSQIIDSANDCLEQSYAGWQRILSRQDICMQDLGFDSLGQNQPVQVDSRYPLERTRTVSDARRALSGYLKKYGMQLETEQQQISFEENGYTYAISYEEKTGRYCFSVLEQESGSRLNLDFAGKETMDVRLEYEDGNARAYAAASVDLGSLTGQEISFEVAVAQEDTSSSAAYEKQGNVFLQKGLGNWQRLLKCVDLTMKEIGFTGMENDGSEITPEPMETVAPTPIPMLTAEPTPTTEPEPTATSTPVSTATVPTLETEKPVVSTPEVVSPPAVVTSAGIYTGRLQSMEGGDRKAPAFSQLFIPFLYPGSRRHVDVFVQQGGVARLEYLLTKYQL